MAKDAYEKDTMKWRPKKSIRLHDAKTSGRVKTCRKCNCTSKGEETCPFCGKELR